MADNPYAKYGGGSGASSNPYAKYRGGTEPAPETPTSTAGEAAGRGFFNAATFNFYDELKGLARAGGFDPDDPETDNEIKALFKGGYRYFTGDKEAERLYEAEKNRVAAESKRLEEAHPYASFGGAVAGVAPSALATPIRAATMGGRALQAGLAGGAQGAAAGAGAGEDAQSRLTGGALGGGIGAGIGAVAQPATEFLGRRVAEHLGPLYRTARGLIVGETPEAQRAIGAAVLRDQPGGRGLTMPEYRAELAAGSPVANVDLGDVTTRALARSSANVSPEARAALERTTQDRYAETGERLGNWLTGRFVTPNAAARAQTTAAGREGYRTAYADPAARSVTSDRLLEMANLPEVRSAMKAAEQKANTRAFVEGANYAPLNTAVTIDDAGQLIWRNKGSGTPTYPDLRFWDYTRRELSQEARAAARAGRNDEASMLSSLARMMNQELDSIVPAYQTAREGAASFLLRQGRDLFGAAQRRQLPEMERSLARMSPERRAVISEGYAQRLVDQLRSQGGAARTTWLRRLQQAPDARRELEVGLGGPQAADEFMARIRVEDIMDRVRGALGNSTTARQLLEVGLAGGGAGAYYGGGDISTIGQGAGIALALRTGGGLVGRAVHERVARRIGELLASNDASHVQRGIELVTRNPPLRRAFEAGHEALMGTGLAVGARAAPQLVPQQE